MGAPCVGADQHRHCAQHPLETFLFIFRTAVRRSGFLRVIAGKLRLRSSMVIGAAIETGSPWGPLALCSASRHLPCHACCSLSWKFLAPVVLIHQTSALSPPSRMPPRPPGCSPWQHSQSCPPAKPYLPCELRGLLTLESHHLLQCPAQGRAENIRGRMDKTPTLSCQLLSILLYGQHGLLKPQRQWTRDLGPFRTEPSAVLCSALPASQCLQGAAGTHAHGSLASMGCLPAPPHSFPSPAPPLSRGHLFGAALALSLSVNGPVPLSAVHHPGRVGAVSSMHPVWHKAGAQPQPQSEQTMGPDIPTGGRDLQLSTRHALRHSAWRPAGSPAYPHMLAELCSLADVGTGTGKRREKA